MDTALPQHNLANNQAEHQSPPLPVEISVGMTIENARLALLVATLRHTNSNKVQTAQILGITVKSVYNLLHRYGLMDEFKPRAT